MKIRKVLVTGASGKLGRALVPALQQAGYAVRVTQFRSPVDFEGVEVVAGDMADAGFVAGAIKGVDAVCHLATCKEDRAAFIDTSIRGTFNLLDEAMRQGKLKQFLLASGDAALGIYFNPQPAPLSETAPLAAYPGYYAFSKVMEEVMCGQYHVQYGLPTTVLRISWIHDEDDTLAHLLVREGNFGVPQWKTLATSAAWKRIVRSGGAVGCVRHGDGRAYVRHIVALRDVVHGFLAALGNPQAVGQTFNIAGPAPFSYDVAAEYAAQRLKLPVIDFVDDAHHDFTIDIGKARAVLGYRPEMDIFRMIDAAIAFRESGGRRQAVRYVG